MSGPKILDLTDPMNLVLSTLGRCGSKYFIRNLKLNKISRLANWNHYYPDELISVARREGVKPKNLKVIFLFSDPVEIVLSVKKRELDVNYKWIEEHFKNLKSDIRDYKDIYNKDALNLERMFDKFYQNQKFNLLTLRYENISQNIGIISNFIGKEFRLKDHYVARKPRIDSVSSDNKKSLRLTYGGLSEKINNAEDCKIWSPIYG